MNTYTILVNILDELRKEAPLKAKRYHPSQAELDKIANARARAFIHLYLKVKFGLLTFSSREDLLTDESADGGIDAYFIDKCNKTIHLIQSKFRTTEKNFEANEITVEELTKIEADRIIKGETLHEDGVTPYNGKIRKFQDVISKTENLGQYKYRLVFLANFKHKPLLDVLYKDYIVDLFDFTRAYKELVFPVVSGTYFKAENLHLSISLENTNSGASRVSYSVSASGVDADVTIIFAPVKEIGAAMSRYRNSILEYNPRSFLGLVKNSVNAEIEKTILQSTDNQFALFNNGITIVADQMSYSDKTGKKSQAHLDLVNPQIINGGQTAYTLCKIFDDISTQKAPSTVFDGKEVLLKIITIDPEGATFPKRKDLISKISKATNLQTPVEESDRRSNEEIQISLQAIFFKEHGLFYERKAGEFFDGLRSKYIKKSSIVDRDILMRVALAKNFRVSETKARVKNFFSAVEFNQSPLTESDVGCYTFGYECYQYLSDIMRETKKAEDSFLATSYGSALRYGRYAVIAVVMNRFFTPGQPNPKAACQLALNRWKMFENWAEKRSENKRYFFKSSDWNGYYKGETINGDIEAFDFTSAPVTAPE